MPKVLVVEDDAAVAAAVAAWLDDSEFLVDIAYDGTDGLYRLQHSAFDVAILDWHLPGLTGPELCSAYRKSGGQAAILMLTKRDAASAKIEGLDAGADDYLTKPFDGGELVARVRALLRRPAVMLTKRLERASVQLDYNSCSVIFGERTVKLLRKEFDVLEFLLKHSDKYFSSEDLLKHVWSSESDTGPETVRVLISRIRNKVDTPNSPSLIETSKGWGYKIAEAYLRPTAREGK